MRPSTLLVLFLAVCATLGACGGDDGGTPGSGASSSNGATSNGTSSTSNGGTTATSNGTGATSNGTASTSNATTSTSNSTVATSNGTSMAERLDVLGGIFRTVDTGASLDLQVRYIDAAGEPVVGSVTRWSLSGDPEGTTLESDEQLTEADGIATVRLVVGSTPTRFGVDVTASEATASFFITAAIPGADAYQAQVDYSGARRLGGNTFQVFLLPDPESRCSTINVTRLSDPAHEELLDTAPIWPDLVTVRELTVGSRHTVVARAFVDDNTQTLGAWGCNDSRPPITGEDVLPTLDLEMTDIGPDLNGEWNVQASVDLLGLLPEQLGQGGMFDMLRIFASAVGLASFVPHIADRLEMSEASVSGQLIVVLGAMRDNLSESSPARTAASMELYDILRQVQLYGTMSVQPGAPGEPLTFTFNFTRAGYRWTHCMANESHCAEPSMDLAEMNLPNITATATGQVEPSLVPGVLHQVRLDVDGPTTGLGLLALEIFRWLALPHMTGNSSVQSLRDLFETYLNCDSLGPGVDPRLCSYLTLSLDSLALGRVAEPDFAVTEVGAETSGACVVRESQELSPSDGQPHPPAAIEVGGEPRCGWIFRAEYGSEMRTAGGELHGER